MPSRILSSLLCSQRSERREQKKQACLIFYAEPLSIFDVSQRSERREQRQTKTKFSSLAMPSRLLSSLRQKQSSANEGRSKTFVLIMPSAANLRCAAVKEVKGESRDKRKRSFQVWLCRAESYLRCARSKVMQTRAEAKLLF